MFYSDFDVVYLEFRMRIDPAAGDDDIVGFVLGWQPGDGINNPPSQDFVVVDWKRLTQSYQNWGTANEGLALSRMQGTRTPGYGGAPIDLWSHTLNCTELARGNQYGNTGWQFGVDYDFAVLYTPASIDIWVDDVLEFSVNGTFNPGRFGCYNISQSLTEFQFPVPGSFTTVGSGCAGSAGTPYLFSPETPYVGESLPLIVADVPVSAPCLLALGTSDTSWNGVPLPASLAPLGALGCQAFNSPDVLLPMGNFNGTGYLTFDLPASLTPSLTPALFAQAVVVDLAANPMGLTVSNGGAIAAGIR